MYKNKKESEIRIENINNISKYIIALIFVFSIFANAWLIVQNVSKKKELQELKNKCEKDINRSSEQYSILYNKNNRLQKELQDLEFKLIETMNNTIELTVMLQQLENENVTLYNIKDELTKGVNRTNYQLKSMQKSVNALIDQKQKRLNKQRHHYVP